jgi:hypothetical protein
VEGEVRLEERSAASFLSYLGKVRERTARVVARIPEERLEWTYRPGKFTLGDIVRHLAGIERYMFAENVRGNPSRYPGHGRELAEGPEPSRPALPLSGDAGDPHAAALRADGRRGLRAERTVVRGRTREGGT